MSNDEKWQAFGKTLGDVAEYAVIYLGILFAVIVLLVFLLVLYRKKRKEQTENAGNPKQNTSRRILLYVVIGVFVFLLSPLILWFFLD